MTTTCAKLINNPTTSEAAFSKLLYQYQLYYIGNASLHVTEDKSMEIQFQLWYFFPLRLLKLHFFATKVQWWGLVGGVGCGNAQQGLCHPVQVVPSPPIAGVRQKKIGTKYLSIVILTLLNMNYTIKSKQSFGTKHFFAIRHLPYCSNPNFTFYELQFTVCCRI